MDIPDAVGLLLQASNTNQQTFGFKAEYAIVNLSDLPG